MFFNFERCDFLTMFKKIAKHRANDASLMMHRPPLPVNEFSFHIKQHSHSTIFYPAHQSRKPLLKFTEKPSRGFVSQMREEQNRSNFQCFHIGLTPVHIWYMLKTIFENQDQYNNISYKFSNDTLTLLVKIYKLRPFSKTEKEWVQLRLDCWIGLIALRWNQEWELSLETTMAEQ